MVRSGALAFAVLSAGCAGLAGLDDLHVDAAATDASLDVVATDTKHDVASTCSAKETGPACAAGMVAVPGGCYYPPLDSKPAIVQPFCVDATEVTMSAYRACADAGECPPVETTVTRRPGDSDMAWAAYNSACNANISGRDDHPVNCVDALAADAYCAWKGRRLPTDAEWGWIARNGDAYTIYPWGDQVPKDQPCWHTTDGTCAVATHADKSLWDIYDLAANVSEWTSTKSGAAGRLARGGAYFSETPIQLSGTTIGHDTDRFNTVGFRCAD
jgi:formylglycine-generating enzyme required for sulfatase activity